MNEPIEEVYFSWLCAKVHQVDNPTPTLTYWKLLRQLHNVEFVWLLSGDDNRAADGLDLRIEFYHFMGDNTPQLDPIGCSVLEMLIALTRHAEFDTAIPAKDWFWKFIENLGLQDESDGNYYAPHVSNVIDRFIWRTHSFDGHGGLFPLRNTDKDQRKIEIWYQFCEYLTEQDI